MGIKDSLGKLTNSRSRIKELQKDYELDMKAKENAFAKQKSANERELERLEKEEREKMIDKRLEQMRWKKYNRDNFQNKVIDTPNVVNNTKWEVMREKNQFANRGNMFSNNSNIHKDNKTLFKHNKGVFSDGGIMRNKQNFSSI